MKVNIPAFNVNLFVIGWLLFAALLGWFVWERLLVPTFPAGWVAGRTLTMFAMFLLATGALVERWSTNRMLAYYWRCQGYNEEAVAKQVEEMRSTMSEMPTPELFRGPKKY